MARIEIVPTEHGARYSLPPRRTGMAASRMALLAGAPSALLLLAVILAGFGLPTHPDRVALLILAGLAFGGFLILVPYSIYSLLGFAEIEIDDRRITAVAWIAPFHWTVRVPLGLIEAVNVDATGRYGHKLVAELWTGERVSLVSQMSPEVLAEVERYLDVRVEAAQAHIVRLAGVDIVETPWIVEVRTRRRALGRKGWGTVAGIAIGCCLAAGVAVALAPVLKWFPPFDVIVPIVIGAGCLIAAGAAALTAFERFEISLSEHTLAWTVRVGPFARRRTLKTPELTDFSVARSERRRVGLAEGSALTARTRGGDGQEFLWHQAPRLLEHLKSVLQARLDGFQGAGRAHVERVRRESPPAPSMPRPPETPPAPVLSAVTSVTGECQVCGDSMTTDVVSCARCRTPHHRECWRYMNRCSTYGCGGREYNDTVAAAVEEVVVIEEPAAASSPASPSALLDGLAREHRGVVRRDVLARRQGRVLEFDHSGAACRLSLRLGRRGYAAEFLAQVSDLGMDELRERARAKSVLVQLTAQGVHVRPSRRLQTDGEVREFLQSCLEVVGSTR